jgi:hypothetical protein
MEWRGPLAGVILCLLLGVKVQFSDAGSKCEKLSACTLILACKKPYFLPTAYNFPSQ